MCRTLASVRGDGNGKIGKIYGKAASRNAASALAFAAAMTIHSL
jgi:hypothetical protein